MRISGFSIVRNADVLDFPVEASLRSILPLCDELVVNVGVSEDHTLERVRSIGDPRIRVLESTWDFSRGEAVLREETARAMRACRAPWGLYIQADEVLHEQSLSLLDDAVASADRDPRVEGLVVRYHHIFGDPETEAINRRWYRREVRVVRLGAAYDVRPYRDAQGFRVGLAMRRVRARLTDAEMFHYGWLRSAAALRSRGTVDRSLYPGRWVPPVDQAAVLRWFPGLTPFRGTHPAVAREWVAARARDPGRIVTPPFFAAEHLRFYASDLVERLTGRRPFEFRNYTLR
jgi:hypothetical protein